MRTDEAMDLPICPPGGSAALIGFPEVLQLFTSVATELPLQWHWQPALAVVTENLRVQT
jgi:hypothetical protein